MNEDIISIGANCIVRIRNRFFLLVEIEVEVGNVAIEEFVFIRISEQEARTLLAGGIQLAGIPNGYCMACIIKGNLHNCIS
ncbi:hypothetical protein AT281_23405 [Bacillus cereus]|nr:hypothetical protein [Bacillus cereus]KXZ04591.1 hypothetical protein AT281_23405 [Bacillus cereus]